MPLRVPIFGAEIEVPGWCVAVWLLWPVVFLSFVAHSLAIGGDALNGKAEAGRYYLWTYGASGEDGTRYTEVSKARYSANCFHSVAMILIAVPAVAGTLRVLSAVRRQSRRHAESRNTWRTLEN